MGQGNEKEIEVKEKFELLVKDDGQEGEYIVLLVANDVRSKLALQLVFPDVKMSSLSMCMLLSTHLVVVKAQSEICPLIPSATTIAEAASS